MSWLSVEQQQQQNKLNNFRNTRAAQQQNEFQID